MASPLEARIIHEDGGVTVALAGELDLEGAEALKGFRVLASRYDADQLTLDCAALTFVDAAGLRVLLAALQAFERNASPRLVNVPRAVQRVLDVTGAAARFEVLSNAP
jgi:anti-anti-sigma factor